MLWCSFNSLQAQAREKQQSERTPVSSIKVTSRKVSSGSGSRHLGLPRYRSVDLLISPSPSETRLSEIAVCSPHSSRESLHSTSQHELLAASPAESSEPKSLSLDLSRHLFTQTVIVGVKSPVRSQSFDTFRSIVAESAEEDLSPTSADRPDKEDCGSSSDGRGLQVITEEEEKAAKEKIHTSADLQATSSPLDSKEASEVTEGAIVDQNTFQPVTFASPETLPNLEEDTCTPITEKACLDSCVPDQTPDEGDMSGRRRMIIKPSAYGPRKEQKLTTSVPSESSGSSIGVTSPTENASMSETAKEGVGLTPPMPQPVPETTSAFRDMVLTLQLQSKETKFGFMLSDVAGVGGLFAIESITPGKCGIHYNTCLITYNGVGKDNVNCGMSTAVTLLIESSAALHLFLSSCCCTTSSSSANIWLSFPLYTLPPPSFPPSLYPSFPPSLYPSFPPSLYPSFPPSLYPSLPPSLYPSFPPSLYPSFPPSLYPSFPPSLYPSFPPSLPPTPGSPASRTDMRPSDLLLKVNSTSTEGLGYKQVTGLVKKVPARTSLC